MPQTKNYEPTCHYLSEKVRLLELSSLIWSFWSFLVMYNHVHLTQEDVISGAVIRELILLRDGFMESMLSNTDIIEILETLCTS